MFQGLRCMRVGAVGFVLMGVFTLVLAGCATKVVYGTPPKTDSLGTLRPGESSAQEVKRVLGEPSGKGMMRTAPMSGPETVWSYEFTEAEGKQVHLKLLLVFLVEDVYQGYLWFSSVELMEQAK